MVAKATRTAASSGFRTGRKLALSALGGAAGVLQTFTQHSPARGHTFAPRRCTAACFCLPVLRELCFLSSRGLRTADASIWNVLPPFTPSTMAHLSHLG